MVGTRFEIVPGCLDGVGMGKVCVHALGSLDGDDVLQASQNNPATAAIHHPMGRRAMDLALWFLPDIRITWTGSCSEED